MKKIIKRILLIIAVLFSIILIDTLQAKIFNNSPIIHVREYFNGGGALDYVDYGIFVAYYKYANGKGITRYVWVNVLF